MLSNCTLTGKKADQLQWEWTLAFTAWLRSNEHSIICGLQNSISLVYNIALKLGAWYMQRAVYGESGSSSTPNPPESHQCLNLELWCSVLSVICIVSLTSDLVLTLTNETEEATYTCRRSGHSNTAPLGAVLEQHWWWHCRLSFLKCDVLND